MPKILNMKSLKAPNPSCAPVEITSIDSEGSLNLADPWPLLPMTNQIGHSVRSNQTGKGDSPVLTRQCRNSHVQGPLVPMIVLLRSPRQLRADTLREAVGPPLFQAQHLCFLLSHTLGPSVLLTLLPHNSPPTHTLSILMSSGTWSLCSTSTWTESQFPLSDISRSI